MKRTVSIFIFSCALLLSWGLASSEDGFYVISVKKNNYAPVPKSGQTTSYATGDDGELQKGVVWPTPRFTDNNDGTVTDNLTELVWLKNPLSQRNWAQALVDCGNLADDGINLTDGSSAGDWRMPNVRELLSLIDFKNYNPALPSDHPFTGVQSDTYWSGTTVSSDSGRAWYVGLYQGYWGHDQKGINRYLWPVRDDN